MIHFRGHRAQPTFVGLGVSTPIGMRLGSSVQSLNEHDEPCALYDKSEVPRGSRHYDDDGCAARCSSLGIIVSGEATTSTSPLPAC